jgi:hypothetical protein
LMTLVPVVRLGPATEAVAHVCHPPVLPCTMRRELHAVDVHLDRLVAGVVVGEAKIERVRRRCLHVDRVLEPLRRRDRAEVVAEVRVRRGLDNESPFVGARRAHAPAHAHASA